MRKARSVNALLIILLSLSALFSPLAFSENKGAEYHFSVRLGGGMAPIYTGSSKYTVIPVIGAEAVATSEQWGTFRADEKGLSWLLPIDSPLNLALLVGYDEGRKEKIQTTKGKNNDLKGMGNLKAAPEFGIALIYREGPYHLYLKGMMAATKRNYGGEELGHTSRAELGGGFSFPLTEKMSGSFNVVSTWGDSKFIQGHFGVTRQQARDSQFQYYKPGSGIKDISYQAAIDYQFTPSFALQAAVGQSYLPGDAGHSPLTKSRTEVVTGVALNYSF